ncbi:MAG: cysteine desulfurase, partial [Betaproteobacteria bacterium]
MSNPDGVTGLAPAGLPDIATLTRLAGEFFSALPGTTYAAGGVPVPVNPQPAGLSLPPGTAGPATPAAVPFGALPPGFNLAPQSPQTPANALASAPALRPHAVAPNGVPDLVLTAAPGYDNRFGGQALGVPEAVGSTSPTIPSIAPLTPSLPQVDAPKSPALPSTSPYYFLDERGAGRDASPVDLPANDRVDPQSFGLPGAEALHALLARIPHGNAPSLPGGGVPSSGATQFYFLDAPATPQAAPSGHPPFDVNAVRRDFPILRERVNGRPLVWFDNAATTQKPQAV